MIIIRIGETEYSAIEVAGRMSDPDWDNRESKVITLEMTYEDAIEIFWDGVPWSIITEDEIDGQIIRREFDNSDFNMAGDITDHRDGTLSVKMGKMTDLEEAYELLYGGIDE